MTKYTMKRLVDLLLSALLLLVFSPILLLLGVAVWMESGRPVFFKQIRVGKGEKEFTLLKFRSMYVNAEARGQLTLGDRDPRVTRVGYFLRKSKLDELPQLINVFRGDMSLVGPRPEVPKYVALYNEEQRKVLNVKPGITDMASIEYMDEAEILAQAEDPEKKYIEEVMPHKLSINLSYQKRRRGVLSDLKVLVLTALKIFR